MILSPIYWRIEKIGQYFYVVNLTKREFLHPHKLGSGLKLWELCASSASGVIPYLLRKSDEGGGGDQNDSKAKWCGHWAMDNIAVIGDYDSSRLFQEIDGDEEKPKQIMGGGKAPWKDVSLEVREEYEKFLGEPLGERWDKPR